MKAIRIAVSALLVTVVAASAFAFMAHNSVDASMAGEGSGVVSGYHVSGISYDISPTDPSIVTGVSFTLDAPAKTVLVKFEPPSGGIVSGTCTGSNNNKWTCDWPHVIPVLLEDLNELEVMAAQ